MPIANMTANPLTNAIQLLENFGFFEMILPMLLIFAIFYAVLIKTKILGDYTDTHVKAVCALVSFVAAFMVVAYTPIIVLIQPLIAQSAFLLIVVMLILMILAFTGAFNPSDISGKHPWWMWPIVIGFIIIFLGIIDASGFYIPGIHGLVLSFMGESGPTVNQDTWNLIIALIVFIGLPVAVIALVVKSTK